MIFRKNCLQEGRESLPFSTAPAGVNSLGSSALSTSSSSGPSAPRPGADPGFGLGQNSPQPHAAAWSQSGCPGPCPWPRVLGRGGQARKPEGCQGVKPLAAPPAPACGTRLPASICGRFARDWGRHLGRRVRVGAGLNLLSSFDQEQGDIWQKLLMKD